MSSGQKTVSVFLSLISALLVLILGLTLDWPVWMWSGAISLLLVAGTVGAVTATRVQQRAPFPPGTLPEQPSPPVERRELQVTRVPIPSQLADYDFLFSARVRWCPVDPTSSDQLINPGALAVEAVLARARQVTSGLKPFRSALVQHELNGALGVMERDREGHVQAMALDVHLTLADEDQERLDRLAAIRKDEAVWEHQRKYEQNKREYLGDDVLQSTGSAVVWWLAKNDDHVEKTVKDIGLLARLSSAANNAEVDEPFRHLVPDSAHSPGMPGPAFPGAEQADPLPDRAPLRSGPDAPEAADLFTDAFRLVGFRPGDDESALIADQLALAISARDSATAEELRRRFGGQPTAPHADGTDPSAQDDGPADQDT
ncbi:hypothetical protein AB0O76_19860 [Streptomyces sp. NPDC086554]|uniref:hypothetical protein n=1 Tax=Streptomyces sp. NPDC086554 TaxID=3154864 RepID=UPI003416BBEA